MEYEAEFAPREVDLIDDPLSRLPDGTTIWKQTLVFGGSDADVKPEEVRDWGFFDGALLAVGFGDWRHLEIHGTAVMVAPGLAITATHVRLSGIS